MTRQSNLPPMPMRDSAGSLTLDNPDDGTPIRETLALNSRLLIFTDKRAHRAAGLRLEVAELPDSFQQARHVRFGYVARLPDGRVLPFG